MLDAPRPWWVLASLPLGLTTWVGLLYAGVRARMRSMQVLAAVFFALMVAELVLVGDYPEGSTREELGEAVAAGMFFLGIGVSLAFVPVWQRRLRSGRAEAERRLAERREALRLARENPELAREVGIGRPHVPTAQHAGLVDVNSAPVEVLARLPGVDDALAAEIVRAREEIAGFRSLADLGEVLRLPGDVVEDLRERVVFLPR